MATVTATTKKVTEYVLTLTEDEAIAVCQVLGFHNSAEGVSTYTVYYALATALETQTGEHF